MSFGAINLPELDGDQTISLWAYYASIPTTRQTFLVLANATSKSQLG